MTTLIWWLAVPTGSTRQRSRHKARLMKTHNMLVARLSRQLNAGVGVTSAEMTQVIDALSKSQRDAIKAKCSWEHVSWLGVLKDWPMMFMQEETSATAERK